MTPILFKVLDFILANVPPALFYFPVTCHTFFLQRKTITSLNEWFKMYLLIVYRHLLYLWALGCLFINPEFSFPCVSTLCARITKGTFRLQETEQGLLGMRLETGKSSQGSRIWLVQLRWCCNLGPALCMTSFSQSQCRQPWHPPCEPLLSSETSSTWASFPIPADTTA